MTSPNLVLDPSFRRSDVGAATYPWLAINGATITHLSSGGYYGSSLLRVIKSASVSSGVETRDYISVTAGLPYSASAYVKIPVAIPAEEEANLIIKVIWYNSSNFELSEDISDVLIVSDAGRWKRLTISDITAPVGATKAKIRISQPAIGLNGAEFYLDAVLFEQSSYVGSYRDSVTQAEETAFVNKTLTVRSEPNPFSGMELNADVSLIGEDFNLTLNTIDEDQVVWVCTDIDGWWGQSDSQIPDIARGVEDGSYDVIGRYTSRQLTLKGVFLPPDPSKVSTARDRLIAATNLVRKGAWLKTNENPTRASFVRLAGRPQIQTVNARGRTEFSIPIRAADPIRYEWNDDDFEGFTNVEITGVDQVGTVTNAGTAPVTATFNVTGPAGSASYITNSRTNQTMSLSQALRGTGPIANITKAQIYKDVATLTTDGFHYLQVGDNITVSGLGSPYDSLTGDFYTVIAVTDTYSHTVSFAKQNDDLAEVSTTGLDGVISLASADILSLDTYLRSVSLNGDITGNRYRIDTLADWISLESGDNIISFVDVPDANQISKKSFNDTTDVITIESLEPHFMLVGDYVNIALAETATPIRKQIISNLITLTTSAPHGMSVGDEITVSMATSGNILKKQVSSGFGYITTDTIGGFSIGDTLSIALETVKNIATKARDASTDTTTLTTSVPHGFSTGDTISISMPTNTTLSTKAFSGTTATLTTPSSHYFSPGDVLNITVPTTRTVINKSISGQLVTLTTSVDHKYVSGDIVTINMATSAVPTGTREYSGYANDPEIDYRITLTTAAEHNFVVGDKITVDIGIPSTVTVTNKLATTTTCTLTVSTTHNFSINETITVAIGDARFNGTHVITAVNAGAKTISYAFSGAAVSSAAATGTIVNDTIATGYNGTKVIEDVPSATILKYRYYGPDNSFSSTLFGASPTITNNTNTSLNGTYTIQYDTANKFSYTKVA